MPDDMAAGPAALAAVVLAGYQDSSRHGLLDPPRPARLPGPAGDGPPPWLDCDTDGDLRLARAWARR